MPVKGYQIDASLLDLNDVGEGSPPLTAGDGLIYDGVGFKTEPIPTSAGLNGLPDVVLTPTVGSPTPTTHERYEVLTYDETISKWVNETVPDAGMMAVSTGTFTGGEVQFGSGSPATVTTVTITAGEGFIVDNYTDPLRPVYKHVTWPQFTDVPIAALTSADRTFFAYGGGSPHLVQQSVEFTPAEHRDYIHFGTVGHANRTHAVAVRSNPHAAFDVQLRLSDLAEAIGAFNISGNIYSAAGSPAMHIVKSVGTTYRLGNNFHTSRKQPDITNDASETPVSFNYSYRAGGNDYVLTAATTTIDSANYDGSAGSPAALEAMPSNQWQVQIIKFFAGGAGTRIEYGQTTYGTAAAAIAAIPDVNHVHNPAFAEGVVRGYLVVQEGETDLANATFIEAGKFGAGGSGGSSIEPVFTAAFQSAELGIAANTDYSVAHGLGVKPSGMQAFVVCKTAELGYSIGDEVEFMNVGGSPTTLTYKGIYADSTNIGWHTGDNLVVTNINTVGSPAQAGKPANITLANWKIVLRAYS